MAKNTWRYSQKLEINFIRIITIAVIRNFNNKIVEEFRIFVQQQQNAT